MMEIPDPPEPDDLIDQYDTGQLDAGQLFRQICRHLAILYQLKGVDLIVMNGLLQDMAAVTAELNLARPSAETRQRLKVWAEQAASSGEGESSSTNDKA
jgi:hypothetical protein